MQSKQILMVLILTVTIVVVAACTPGVLSAGPLVVNSQSEQGQSAAAPPEAVAESSSIGALTTQTPIRSVPDLAAVAEVLGISEADLAAALGPVPPNLELAAQILGVTVGELKTAMLIAGSAGAAENPTVPAATMDQAVSLSYPIVDTGQTGCYDDQGNSGCSPAGGSFYGQDAQYVGLQPNYVDNGDGTVTDLTTGLMWQQSPDLNGDGVINVSDKLTFATAVQGADSFSLAGYNDWRLPTIKELYSLMNFNGATGTAPYLDTDYFAFAYGDTSAGERDIDAQFATSTIYVSDVMNGQQAMFGVNFADGRIKGYGIGSTPHAPQGKNVLRTICPRQHWLRRQ
jgi:hypothetical protein